MSPSEFKSRYIASLPAVPPELDLRLDEFFVFPVEAVERLTITAADKAILTVSGLPRQASPFLNFFLPTSDVLQPCNHEYGFPDEFSHYKMIGSNGSGDVICVDDSGDGSVVYLNHDNNLEIVVMNSSVTKLAECLCIFGEFMRSKDRDACMRVMQAADGEAMNDKDFWPFECRSALADPTNDI